MDWKDVPRESFGVSIIGKEVEGKGKGRRRGTRGVKVDVRSQRQQRKKTARNSLSTHKRQSR